MKLLPLIKLGVIIVILTISYLFMEENNTTITDNAISSGGLKYEKGQLSSIEKQRLQEKTIFLDHIKKSR